MAGCVMAVLCIDEWLAPWFPLWLLVCLFGCGAAALELVELLRQTSAKPSRNSVFGGVVVIVLANWAPHLAAHFHRLPQLEGRMGADPLGPVNALAWPLLAFIAVVMCSFIIQSLQFEKPGMTMATISGTILGVAYVGLLGSCVIQMRWFEGSYHGLLALIFLVATAKGADTGAYTCGRIAGRHKLWPTLSPNKTIEGAIGGLAFSVLAALLVSALGRSMLGVSTLERGPAILYGLIVGTTAQLGDLMESMIKRDCSRKDASTAVPGFGGVLDVLDSLLFAGPVAFGFWLSVGL